MEQKTVLTASVTGTLTSKDGKEPEAYKITIVYSDGSKTVLRKKYQEFVDLQVTVYDLLKQKGGYSRKTSRTLVSSLPELNSPLSRILFKDSDLKKMGRMDEFIKELLTLPTVIRESETVMKFFGAFMETSERSEKDEELKKINKVAEMLSGRDPLRRVPEQSPVANRKKSAYSNSSWIPEDVYLLSDERRENLYKKLNERRPSKEIPPLPGKKRTASTDEEIIGKKTESPRPALRRRPFSVAVGIADMFKENREIIENTSKTENSQSTIVPRSSSIKTDKQQSRSDGQISPRSENSDDTESIEYKREEPRARKISPPKGRKSPNRIKYVAISSFVGEESSEISLEDGEEVDVLQKESSGWWYVKNDFGEGWAPSAYLQQAQVSNSTSPEALSHSHDEDSQEQSSQVEEKLNNVPEEPNEKEEEGRSYLQEKQKSLARNGEGGSQNILTEMNRRVKFLTVEGIQKRKNPDKNYVYVLKVVWSDGAINIIYRQCSDFFFLQENLKKEFPTAVGKEIPVLKGRKFTENCQFCFKDGTCKRRQFMNQFCHELINAPDNISKCQAVMFFCKPRSSDVLPHGHSEKTNGKTKEAADDDNNVQISGPVVFEQYIVIADYKKKNTNDISLAAGDTVDVIERNDLGWWLVDHEGELGWAPASHLEPTDDGSEITTSKTFAPGKEEVYQSVQSYQAKAEDELSFDVGVMLKVVEKTLDGWWLVRYQGEEGWAPAMFLKKVNSDDSSTSSSKTMDKLDIVSFDGDSENDDRKCFTRTPPTRRSMVQRSIRRKPKRNSAHQFSETTTPEEQIHSASEKKSDRSISVPARSVTPPVSKRLSPRAKSNSSSRPKSNEFIQGDVDNQWPNRQLSLSSGYGTSPSGSLSSLISDVFTPEENTSPIKKCATLPRFDDINDRAPMPRSNSTTSMAQYKKERSSASGRVSPIPAPRKISAANRKSPLAGSPPRIHDLKTSPRNSGSDMEYENGSDYRNGSDSPRRKISSEVHSPRESQNENVKSLYRAMFTYISQEEGEVTLNEGEVVEVIQRSDNGWYLMRTKDELGWGPSNFLQSVEDYLI